MAASVQALSTGLGLFAPANQPSSISSPSSGSRQSVAGFVKSNLFGTSKVFGSVRSARTVDKVTPGSNTVVSVSLLEKLGKLFSNSEEDEEQVMRVFEYNEADRGSPYLVKNNTKCNVLAVGDFVPYSNKVYDCTGKRYLGISAGFCMAVEHNFEKNGDLYETTMSHYLGDYGHISCQGPYYTYKDSEMVVTGGTGRFKGARGIVKCHNINGPLKLLYTYHIKGIPKLPAELTQTPVFSEEK